MIKSDGYFLESNNGMFVQSFSLEPSHIKNRKEPNYRRVAQMGGNHCVATVNLYQHMEVVTGSQVLTLGQFSNYVSFHKILDGKNGTKNLIIIINTIISIIGFIFLFQELVEIEWNNEINDKDCICCHYCSLTLTHAHLAYLAKTNTKSVNKNLNKI